MVKSKCVRLYFGNITLSIIMVVVTSCPVRPSCSFAPGAEEEVLSPSYGPLLILGHHDGVDHVDHAVTGFDVRLRDLRVVDHDSAVLAIDSEHLSVDGFG